MSVTQSGASPVTALMTDSMIGLMNKPMTDPMNDLIPNTNIVMLLQFRTLPMFSSNEIVLFAILSVGLALSDETSYFLHNVGAPPLCYLLIVFFHLSSAPI